MMKSKIARKLAVICVLVIVWSVFLRDPIDIGEKNADWVEMKDKKYSSMVFDRMPSKMQKLIEKSYIENHQDHLIFLNLDEDYYVMVDTNGTLYKINIKNHAFTEIFSMNAYSCKLKIKENKLYFFTGKRERRDKRNLRARLIHPYKFTVLTNIQKWEYNFDTNTLNKI